MSDKPILFSGAMVRALIDGRKTQTRRILKPQPEVFEVDGKPAPVEAIHVEGRPLPQVAVGRVITRQTIRFAKGDRLWVRERFRGATGYDNQPPSKWGNKPIWYDADGTPDEKLWWHLSKRSRPGIHMPRWASRLMLTVTDVRVQRLQEISDTDCIAEGVEFREDCYGTWNADGTMRCGGSDDPREAYRCLWININGAGSWDANPWIVALTFTVEQRNIGAVT